MLCAVIPKAEADLFVRTDADDLSAQASALAIRDTSSAVARVLGSAAGTFYSPSPLLLDQPTNSPPHLTFLISLPRLSPLSPPLTSSVSPTLTGEFLSSRTYRGLEPRYGMDAPAVMEDMTGRGGVARGYGFEKAEGGPEGRGSGEAEEEE